MAFERYVDAAASSIRLASPLGAEPHEHHPLLNGAPYRAFRQTVDLEERRLAGTFFSGPATASKLASMLRAEVADDAVIMDPTCGMGDLLLAYAALLPIATTLNATLRLWGQQLAGLDTRSDLVRMTKIRLAVLARTLGGFTDAVSHIDARFPKIVVGNMLEEGISFKNIDGFLFNPPFGRTPTPEGVTWGSGQINAAAIFLSKLVESKGKQAVIAALLPEVLRCGSRYDRFRCHLEKMNIAGNYESLGRFDAWTDVDVFITILSDVGKTGLWSPLSETTDHQTLADIFDIRVGTVVPHRHPELGGWKRYICAKTTPAWADAFVTTTYRRFEGKTFKPPFVVIRRTSSPSDRSRAVASIIVGDRDVAVENHLIVLSPTAGDIEICHRLLRALRHQRTSDYLNSVIRCRHLTTKSVASIPWVNGDD